MNRLDDAEKSFGNATAALDKLVRENPSVLLYRRALFRVHFGWAALCMLTGQWDLADEHHRASLKLAEDLARENPDIPDIQNELAVAFSGISEARYWTGQMDQHAAASRKALEIRQKIAREHPNVSHFQGVLELSRHDVSLQSGPVAGAPAGMGAATLDSLRKLVHEHPDIVKYRIQLGHTLNTFGARRQMANQMQEAEAAYREAIAAWREIARIESDVPEMRFLLARSLSNLGALFVEQRGFDQALPFLEEGITLLDRLVRDYPRIPKYAVSIAGNLDATASIARDTKDLKRAREGYERAIHILEDVLKRDPRGNQAKQFLRTTRTNHAVLLIRSGDHRGAVRELESLVAEPLRPDQTYNLGCAFSLAFASALGDGKLTKSERDALTERLVARAVEMLAKAAADGFLNPAALAPHMKTDTDLDPIRSRADYRELIKRIEARAGAKENVGKGTKRGLESPG